MEIADKILEIKKPMGWKLPTTMTNIFHLLWAKKESEYKLDPNYKWTRISPSVLYKLQSGETFVSTIDSTNNAIELVNWKIIMTYFESKDDQNNFVIKAWIDNPIKLDNPDQWPEFERHVKYDGKDYFFLSFTHDAIQGYAQEDFLLVSYDDATWLQSKKIGRVEYCSGIDRDLEYVNWIPTLVIRHEEPDFQDENWSPMYDKGEYRYTETFSVKDEKLNTESYHKQY